MNNMACGGVERTLVNLLESFDREKYSVDLLLLERAGDFLSLIPEDVRILEADMAEKWRTLLRYSSKTFKQGFTSIWAQKQYSTALLFVGFKLMRSLSSNVTLFRYCAKKIKFPKELYDVVCDYHGYGHTTTYLAARFRDSKRFSWIHVEKIDEDFRRARFEYANFDTFFCVSPQCLTNFAKAFPEIPFERLVLLYNILRKDQIREMGRAVPSIQYSKTERFLLVSVGRLSTQKGFDLAVEAARILKEHGRRFLWIIIGEGPERSNLEAQIKSFGLEKEVVLHGLDLNPYAYMAQADLYIQSSRYEGFATTLSEAIILGKPIVSTSFSGVDQQVIDGKNGLLAAFDPQDLAAKVERMMDDEEFCLSCGQRCADIHLPMDETLKTLERLIG